MEVIAKAKNIRVSPRKLRLALDTVRGKSVSDAIVILRFLGTPAAVEVSKTIQAAAANAENNFEMTPADLKVSRIFADQARTIKRSRAQSRGRAARVLRRSSHLTVVVEEV